MISPVFGAERPAGLRRLDEALADPGDLPGFFDALDALLDRPGVSAAVSRALEDFERLVSPLTQGVRNAALCLDTFARMKLRGPSLELTRAEVARVLRRWRCPWRLRQRELLVGLELERALDVLTVFPEGQRSEEIDEGLREGLETLRCRVRAAVAKAGADPALFGIRLLRDLRDVHRRESDLDALDLRDRALFLAGERATHLAGTDEPLPETFLTGTGPTAREDLALVRVVWEQVRPWIREALPEETAVAGPEIRERGQVLEGRCESG